MKINIKWKIVLRSANRTWLWSCPTQFFCLRKFLAWISLSFTFSIIPLIPPLRHPPPHKKSFKDKRAFERLLFAYVFAWNTFLNSQSLCLVYSFSSFFFCVFVDILTPRWHCSISCEKSSVYIFFFLSWWKWDMLCSILLRYCVIRIRIRSYSYLIYGIFKRAYFELTERRAGPKFKILLFFDIFGRKVCGGKPES